MSETSMASRMLDAAKLLLAEGGHSTAFRRRAVSTAYYAVFHAIARLCADYVTRSAPRGGEDYRRVYRALDHGPLKTAFTQPPLKDSARLSGIGAIVIRLQAERHRADYLPPAAGLFSFNDAQELVDLAQRAIDELQSVERSSNDCRTLAACLLFKERKQ